MDAAHGRVPRADLLGIHRRHPPSFPRCPLPAVGGLARTHGGATVIHVVIARDGSIPDACVPHGAEEYAESSGRTTST